MKRQSLDGFWIGLSRSPSVLGLHLRLNQLQVDNQLHLSTFPVLFQPILSKAANTDFRTTFFFFFFFFFLLSLTLLHFSRSTVARTECSQRSETNATECPSHQVNDLSLLSLSLSLSLRQRFVRSFRYLKLLVQEFSVSLDQTLILAFLAFFKTEQVSLSLSSALLLFQSSSRLIRTMDWLRLT